MSSYRNYTKIICLGDSSEEKRKESSPLVGEEECEFSDVIVALDKAILCRTISSRTFLILLCWALKMITRDYSLKM